MRNRLRKSADALLIVRVGLAYVLAHRSRGYSPIGLGV